jgi:hypothetical protein
VTAASVLSFLLCSNVLGTAAGVQHNSCGAVFVHLLAGDSSQHALSDAVYTLAQQQHAAQHVRLLCICWLVTAASVLYFNGFLSLCVCAVPGEHALPVDGSTRVATALQYVDVL